MVDADRKTGSKRPVALFYSVAFILLMLGVAGWLLIAGGNEAALPVKAAAENNSSEEVEKDAYKMAQVVVPVPQAEPRAIAVSQIIKSVSVAAKNGKVKTVAVAPTSPLPAGDGSSSRMAQNNSQAAGNGEAANSEATNDREPAAGQNNPPVQHVQALPGAGKPVDGEISSPSADQPDGAVVPESPAIAAENYEPLNPVYSRLPFTAGELDLQPTVKVLDEDYYKKKRFKTHFFNAEAGAAYLAGWDVTGGKDGKGLNWFAGVNYGLYVSGKVALGAGVQLYNISHIEKPFYSISTTQYGFGSTGTRTVITTGSLYYAALPIKVYYLLNEHSQFGAGVNIGMPVEARSTVETYGLSDQVVINSQKTTRTGVYEGINTTNLLLSAFYKTRVAKRLYVSGEAVYGVSDIFDNLAQNAREQALGFRLGLSYTLFDK